MTVQKSHSCPAFRSGPPAAWVRLAVLLALLVFGVQEVRAASAPRTISERCDDTDAQGVQAAMITGVAMGLLFGQSLGGPGRAYCPPNSGRLSPGQYRLAVCRFLEEHPNFALQEDYTAVGAALISIYPCK